MHKSLSRFLSESHEIARATSDGNPYIQKPSLDLLISTSIISTASVSSSQAVHLYPRVLGFSVRIVVPNRDTLDFLLSGCIAQQMHVNLANHRFITCLQIANRILYVLVQSTVHLANLSTQEACSYFLSYLLSIRSYVTLVRSGCRINKLLQ